MSLLPTNEPWELVVTDTIDTIEVIVPDGGPDIVEITTWGSRDDLLEVTLIPMIGPPGRDGADGAPGGQAYIHHQASASAVWTVPHNLGYRPAVAITTEGGVEVLGGEIVHLSNVTLVINFNDSFAGYARCI